MADTLADAFTVGWTAMADGTREDYEQLSDIFEGHALETLVPHLLSVMRLLEGPTLGYQIDRARHCRQSATRALRNGESDEFVAAALLYDQNCFDPHHDDLPMEDFVPLLEEVFARPPQYTA